jgi:hypothetical protein
MALSSAERSANYRAKDIEAYRKKKAEYARTPEQRQKRTEYMRKWREENREAFNQMCNASHKRSKLSKSPDERHDQHLRSWYGIDRAEYLSIFEEQGGCCAICGAKSLGGKSKRFHVDHCHKTHKIRGLLCNQCNTRLGWFESNEVAVIAYVSDDYSANKEVRTPSKNAVNRRKFGPPDTTW